MKKKIFCFLIIMVVQLSNLVFGAISAEERAALIALYNSTKGDNWNYNQGWKTPPLHTDGFAVPGTEGGWFGITVMGDYVTGIDLSYRSLNGVIPSQLSNLTRLKILNLGNNSLSDHIPFELGNLSNLEYLYLDNNILRLYIPRELSNLSKLQCLDLSSNQLMWGIPPELGDLSRLEYLDLSSNPLRESIPIQLGKLSNLRVLSLHGARLSGSIPSQLGDLRNLNILYLYENELSGNIPPELGNLINLTELDLHWNQLNGMIPSQLGNLSKLTSIDLRANQLNGSIPSQLGNLSNLTMLDLWDNRLSGCIPSELGNLSNLKRLYLDENQLSGSIPFELGNLSNLEALRLRYNRLSGEIPSSFTNLTSITYLDIAYNCLTATDMNLIAWLNSHDRDWEAHQDQCGGLPEKYPPFGSLDTPVEGSTVAGSIAVTGWALDDGGLASVKIYLIQGDTQTYIGDALLIEGARPDVASAYPDYPGNTKAGWGYMMLTNFFPYGGNGEYLISAIATDLVGKTTILGPKLIYADNTNAVKPFGAIDTPTQGGTAMGRSFVNWGWVLTPQPNRIPWDGSTISVWVDGVNKGHPVYDIHRDDIVKLFPNYANSSSAAGYFYLDTTKYPDGVHTIFWIAADNGGNSEGIGSRYFTIQNNGSDMEKVGGRGQASGVKEKRRGEPPCSPINDRFGAVDIIKGYGEDATAIPQAVYPDENGIIAVVIKELERVEIQLGENNADIRGYLISSNGLNKLPIGSTLDAKNGTFSWIPGPGFIGNYSLVFILTDANGQSFKKSIEIKIEPKFIGK
ncbi:MAG: leucine-rich repeat domain-containing protein [Candidatus Aminicenantes bacterium]|nr:leucine-rich repeat domain-containing protein [Candidatus Aminicenantes bacterium]